MDGLNGFGCELNLGLGYGRLALGLMVLSFEIYWAHNWI